MNKDTTQPREQAKEDQFIIDAVTRAKIHCVHPTAATTRDIGRAVLAAYRATQQAAPEAPTSEQHPWHVPFNPNADCSPTLTQCPRCNNPWNACDRGVATTASASVIANVAATLERAGHTPEEAAKLAAEGYANSAEDRAALTQQSAAQALSRAVGSDDDVFVDVARSVGLNPAFINGVFIDVATAKAYKVWTAAQAAHAGADTERDAARWRAFVGSARIQTQGSAGLNKPMPNHYAHMGLEIWTTYDRDYSPELLGQMDRATALGVEWLTKYADIAVKAQRAALAATEKKEQK